MWWFVEIELVFEICDDFGWDCVVIVDVVEVVCVVIIVDFIGCWCLVECDLGNDLFDGFVWCELYDDEID